MANRLFDSSIAVIKAEDVVITPDRGVPEDGIDRRRGVHDEAGAISRRTEKRGDL